MSNDNRIPRSREDDYSPEIVKARQGFIEAKTGVKLDHSIQYSYDPHVMAGNIENIWGVAQIPIGVAGPFWSTASTHRASSMCPWLLSKALCSPATTAV